MDGNQYWLSLWKAVILGVCTLAMSAFAYYSNQSYQIRKLAEKGYSPIEAACAIKGDTQASPAVCMAVVMKK